MKLRLRCTQCRNEVEVTINQGDQVPTCVTCADLLAILGMPKEIPQQVIVEDTGEVAPIGESEV